MTKSSNTATPELLTVSRACEYSGISRTVLYALGQQRLIDFRKLGRRTYITKTSLDKMTAGLPVAPFSFSGSGRSLIADQATV